MNKDFTLHVIIFDKAVKILKLTDTTIFSSPFYECLLTQQLLLVVQDYKQDFSVHLQRRAISHNCTSPFNNVASSIPSLTLTPVAVNEAKYSMHPKLYKMLVSKDRQDDMFFNIFLLAQQMNTNERFVHKKRGCYQRKYSVELPQFDRIPRYTILVFLPSRASIKSLLSDLTQYKACQEKHLQKSG